MDLLKFRLDIIEFREKFLKVILEIAKDLAYLARINLSLRIKKLIWTLEELIVIEIGSGFGNLWLGDALHWELVLLANEFFSLSFLWSTWKQILFLNFR